MSQSRDFSNAISFNIASLGETTNLVKTLVESLPSSNDHLPPTTCMNFASTGMPWLDGTTISTKTFLCGWAEELGLLPEGKILLETSFGLAEEEGRLPGKGEERDEVSVKEACQTTLFGRVCKIKPSEPISIKTKIKSRKEMQKKIDQSRTTKPGGGANLLHKIIHVAGTISESDQLTSSSHLAPTNQVVWI